MTKLTIGLLLYVGLAGVTLRAEDNSLYGKWRLLPGSGQQVDVMNVKAIGPNAYRFNLGGDTEETIVADGREQAASFGSTLTVSAEAPTVWRVVRKRNGRTEIVGVWKLSADGSTLSDNFTGYRQNGTTFHLDYVYQRTSGGPGFDGRWESTTVDQNAVLELAITPSGKNGVLLNYLTYGMKKDMQFDGRPYPITGGNSPAGYTGTARNLDTRTIEVTNKVKDRAIDMQRIAVSADGKTLTCTTMVPNRDKPQIQVFSRE